MKELKLFVGGYYDERIFIGDFFEEKTPFDKRIETYTLSEVLKLGFVEGVIGFYEENTQKNWEEATEEDRIKAILKYTEGDEIAGLLYFETELEAEAYKNEVINELTDIESNVNYIGKQQDAYGYFREAYKYKRECC